LQPGPQCHRQQDGDCGEDGLPQTPAFQADPVQPYGGLAQVSPPRVATRATRGRSRPSAHALQDYGEGTETRPRFVNVLSDPRRPSVGVLGAAVLDVEDGLAQPHGELTGLAAA